MPYNIVEAARKLANLPTITREGELVTESRRVTRAQFADFVFAVGTLGNDLSDEKDDLKAEMETLKDAKRKLEIHVERLERKTWQHDSTDRLKERCEVLEIPASDAKSLVSCLEAS